MLPSTRQIRSIRERTAKMLGRVLVFWCLALTFLGCSGESFDAIRSVQILYDVSTHDHFSHDAGYDRVPVIATDGTGSWLVAWNSNDTFDGFFDDTNQHLLISRSTDDGATWSDPEPVVFSNPMRTYELNPELTSDYAGTVGLIWSSNAIYAPPDDTEAFLGSDFDIFYSSTDDGGIFWTDPVTVNSFAHVDNGAGGDPAATDVSAIVDTDGMGTWLSIWLSTYDPAGTLGSDGDLFSSRSVDFGETWSTANVVNSTAAVDGGARDFYPDLETNGNGTWIATWSSGYDVFGDDGSVIATTVFSRSTDNGDTWSPVDILGSVVGYWPTVKSDGVGNWIATWGGIFLTPELERSATWGTAVSTSRDDGETWSNAIPISVLSEYSDFSDLESDNAGTWMAIWRSFETIESNFENRTTFLENGRIRVSRSLDNGTTWSEPAELSIEPGFVLRAADNEPEPQEPSLATDRMGNWVAVWSSRFDADGTLGEDLDLFLSRSSDNGKTWTPPQPLGRN